MVRGCRLGHEGSVEGKTGFLFEKDLFSMGSVNKDSSLWPKGSMPGKKAFSSPKKAVIPLGPLQASAVFAWLSLSPGSFCGNKE
jgi:hypothetical protein